MKGTVLDWEIGLESARRTLEAERKVAGFGRCERKKLRQPGFSLVIARKR